jgi:hypothetical protein
MGFRNPIKSLNPDTVVVRNVATADSGRRVVLSSGVQQSVRFYSGDAGEVAPGELTVDIATSGTGNPAGDQSRLILAPPAIGANHPLDVQLELKSASRDGVTKRGTASLLNTDLYVLGNVSLQGSMSYPGAGWTTITPASPLTPGGTGSAFTVRGGQCFLVYDVAYTGAMTKGFVVHTLPTAARPTRDCFIDGYTYTGAQFGLYVHANNGQVTIDTGYASSVSGFVATGNFPVG